MQVCRSYFHPLDPIPFSYFLSLLFPRLPLFPWQDWPRTIKTARLTAAWLAKWKAATEVDRVAVTPLQLIIQSPLASAVRATSTELAIPKTHTTLQMQLITKLATGHQAQPPTQRPLGLSTSSPSTDPRKDEAAPVPSAAVHLIAWSRVDQVAQFTLARHLFRPMMKVARLLFHREEVDTQVPLVRVFIIRTHKVKPAAQVATDTGTGTE